IFFMHNLVINHISSHGLSFLQDSIWESVKQQLSKRVVIVALAALSCLTAVYLVYQCCCWRASWVQDDLDIRNWGRPKDPIDPWMSPVTKAHPQTPSLVQDDIEDFEPEDDVSFDSFEKEKELIQELKQNWLDDPKKEKQRLIDANVLSSSAQDAIQQ